MSGCKERRCILDNALKDSRPLLVLLGPALLLGLILLGPAVLFFLPGCLLALLLGLVLGPALLVVGLPCCGLFLRLVVCGRGYSGQGIGGTVSCLAGVMDRASVVGANGQERSDVLAVND